MPIASKIMIRVPGSTSNLGPGFDCLGLALGIYNDFAIQATPAGSHQIQGRGTCEGLSLKGNPFFAAYFRIGEMAGRQAPPVSVTVEGNVPMGSGLGSSATATVAGALAANYFLGSPIAREGLLAPLIELEGHPDNAAPALLGGLALTAMTTPPLVHIYPVHNSWRLVALMPGYEMKTSKARELLPEEIKRSDAIYNLSRLPMVLDALIDGDAATMARVMGDRWHERYRAKKIKRHDKIREAALEAGAVTTFVSGSGPVLIALTQGQKATRAVAKAMQAACEDAKFTAQARELSVDTQGAQLAELKSPAF